MTIRERIRDMLHGNLMSNVKVKKGELLDTLRTNLEKHQTDVAEALESRRDEMLEYFKQAAEQLEQKPGFQPKENIKFPMPKDNSDSYQRAIRMAEMTVDDVIELTEDQFDKLVMDNWHWKEDFLATSAFYGKAK